MPIQYSTNIVKTQNFQHFSLAYGRKHSQYSFTELNPNLALPVTIFILFYCLRLMEHRLETEIPISVISF